VNDVPRGAPSLDGLGSPVARGRTAEIYAWHEGWVLKLFHDWMSQEAIQRESEITRAVHACGLPVPGVGDTVQIGRRCGVVFERVEGASMLAGVLRQPWKAMAASRDLAALHGEIHTRVVPGLPSLKDRLAAKIGRAQLPSEGSRARALDRLAQLPDGDSLCHGDFHPDNVLVAPEGPVIIDWVDASSGDPAADVARTLLLLSGGAPPPGALFGSWLNVLRYLARRSYLRGYEQRCPGIGERAASWLPVVVAGRLSEDIPEERAQLQAFVRRHFSP
jgi:aminoglycoside phosphotransferase (APT) family kinase protein